MVLVLDRADSRHQLEVARQPRLERALQPPVVGEADVVRDSASRSTMVIPLASGRRRAAAGAVARSAPSGPTALGRWKIQFCQAESRAKILVSIVSGPGTAGSPPCR